MAAWIGELRGSAGGALFEVAEDQFRLRRAVAPEHHAVMEQLLGELLDYRLCRYLDRTEVRAGE